MPASASAASREAGVAPRLAALLLDAGIIVVLFAALNLVLHKFGVLPALEVSQPSPLLALWSQAGPWIALTAILGCLVILAWAVAAGTPGALLMGLNVLRVRDRCRAGVLRCAWRLVICVALCGLGFLGAWRGKRALHDRLSGTRVVREDESTLHYYQCTGQTP